MTKSTQFTILIKSLITKKQKKLFGKKLFKIALNLKKIYILKKLIILIFVTPILNFLKLINIIILY